MLSGEAMRDINKEHFELSGWRPAKGFGFARRVALVPLAVAEIVRVSQVMTVVFRTVAGRWEAAAVLGPVKGANLYVSRDEKWCANFVPAALRVYPFCLNDAGDLCLWDDFDPEQLNCDGIQPFFEDGKLSPRVLQVKKFLNAYREGVHGADHCLSKLEKAGALAPWEVPGIEIAQPEHSLAELYAIDRKALETLNDALVLELFRAGALRWMHAHLDSLHHAERFKVLARAIVAPEVTMPRQPNKIEQAADILAALAQDLGDAEL